MTASSPDPSASARASAVRWFGRLQLIRLLGKSERTMAWQVADPRSGQELLLVLPRVQPADAAALQYWQQAVRQASRLNHPQLAAVVEYGVQDGWPFVAYDPRDCATLAERNSTTGLPGVEAAGLAAQALQGLAFAHEAGVAHHDLQPYLLLLSDSGQVRVAGLAVASEMAQRAANVGIPAAAPASDTITLSAHRMAAERDVLALGVLLHSVLAGSGALEDADIGRIILRLPPYSGTFGRDIVRLPWSTAHPIAEPLRAIVNRATDRQERIRYRNARTLLRALEGWLQTDAAGDGGTHAFDVGAEHGKRRALLAHAGLDGLVRVAVLRRRGGLHQPAHLAHLIGVVVLHHQAAEVLQQRHQRHHLGVVAGRAQRLGHARRALAQADGVLEVAGTSRIERPGPVAQAERAAAHTLQPDHRDRAAHRQHRAAARNLGAAH